MSNKERRKDPRFRVEAQALAVLRPDYTIVGRIQDMSISGMMFEYSSFRKQYLQYFMVDIIIKGKGFYLPDLSCRKAWHSSAMGDGQSGPTTHRCGISFIFETAGKRAEVANLLASGLLAGDSSQEACLADYFSA